MQRREFNPVPEIFEGDPDAGSGDFLAGLMIDRDNSIKIPLDQEEQNPGTPSRQKENTDVIPENPNQ